MYLATTSITKITMVDRTKKLTKVAHLWLKASMTSAIRLNTCTYYPLSDNRSTTPSSLKREGSLNLW